jgi:hypothetical protein
MLFLQINLQACGFLFIYVFFMYLLLLNLSFKKHQVFSLIFILFLNPVALRNRSLNLFLH